MPSAITIREARREDVPRIAELIMLGAAVASLSPGEIAAEARDPVYLDAFERVAASPDSTLFAAERDGHVIGTFQLTVIPGLAARGRSRAKVESVHVAPECRGQGIGALMMERAVSEARARGAGLLELSSHKQRPDAHRFYRRLGFAMSHEGFKLEL